MNTVLSSDIPTATSTYTYEDFYNIQYAKSGNLEALKSLHKQGYKFCDLMTKTAAKCGHLECLKYLHEHDCKWHPDTLICAICNGHLECLKYLHEHGCEWHEGTTSFAAMYKQNECLKYAMENGCEWNEYTTTAAATHNNLEVLRYAHENHHFIHPDTALRCVDSQHVECFTYLFSICDNPQTFWQHAYDKIIPYLNFSRSEWTPLFSIDLTRFPTLQAKIDYIKFQS